MRPIILLVKSWVRPHTRRLPDGRVVQVAGHQDRRTHQQEANPHQRELDLEVANNPAGPRSSSNSVGAAPSPRSAPNRAEGGAPTHREDPQLAALLKLYAGDEEVTPEELREAVRQYREVESRYRGTPQWLQAPNGEPTNLNERQWVLVRTSNFKRWFGDWEGLAQQISGGRINPDTVSKVVDANGEPLVVYHGTTRAGFSVFHARSHFGTLPSASQRLETQADLRERRAAGHRQRIERGGEAAERARNALDRLEAGKSLEVGAADAIYQVFLNLRRPLDAVDAFDTREPFAEDWEDELRAAEARRYDGVRYRNAVEDRGSVSWLVMRPQDVKSAIGNAGTFRPDLGHVNKAILFFARTR